MGSFWQGAQRVIAKWWWRGVISGLCLGIVVGRMIWPTLTVDWITVALLAISVLVLRAPEFDQLTQYFRRILPYIRKASVAGIAVEFTDDIKKIGEGVEKAEKALEEKGEDVSVAAEYGTEKQAVISSMTQDPRAAMLLLASRIEERIMTQLRSRGLLDPGRFMPVRAAVRKGVEAKIFPMELQSPFEDFWAIRNKVAHGAAFDVPDSSIAALVSVGLELLGLLSIDSAQGTPPNR